MEIELLYPGPLATDVVLAPYAAEYDDPLPAVKRQGFREAVAAIRKGKARALAVADVRALGRTAAHVASARRAVENAGGLLVTFGDDDRETIAGLLDHPGVRALAERIAPPGTIRVRPASMCEKRILRNHCTFIDEHGPGADVYLLPEAGVDDVAHEIAHVEMHHEGYPILLTPGDLTVGCAILDVEVDRRLATLGIDAARTTDRHLAGKLQWIRSSGDVDNLFWERVMRTLLHTHTSAVRDEFIGEADQALSEAERTAAASIVAAVQRVGLDTADRAVAVFEEVAAILRTDLRMNCRAMVPRDVDVSAAFADAGKLRVTPSRNDPCFCGSGRKFKKCCGGNAKP